MNVVVLIAMIAAAVARSNAQKKNTNTARTPAASAQRRQQTPRTPKSSRTLGYIDDGVLSQDEIIATMLTMKRYKELDSASQNQIRSLMDARILAQFNHLLNSSWNMDDVMLFEYLSQQGRQGRYTELGAFALAVRNDQQASF